HTVVVLSPPGLGDDIQAIKAGILEIADIHVVSKADKPEAAATVAALKGMLALGRSESTAAWTPPVLAVSSLSGDSLDSLTAAIHHHWTHLQESGGFAARERSSCEKRIFQTARELLQEQFHQGTEDLEVQIEAVARREADPLSAAHVLLGWTRKGRK
ncbi:MAG: methylmalonyl Co-A mutase-associated GTPase MeaB, partial [Bradyrhizobium sp.]